MQYVILRLSILVCFHVHIYYNSAAVTYGLIFSLLVTQGQKLSEVKDLYLIEVCS